MVPKSYSCPLNRITASFRVTGEEQATMKNKKLNTRCFIDLYFNLLRLHLPLFSYYLFLVQIKFSREHGPVLFKVVQTLNFQVQQFDLIIDTRLCVSNLSFRKLYLVKVKVHPGEVAVFVPIEVDFVREFSIGLALLSNFNLRQLVLQVPVGLPDSYNDLILFVRVVQFLRLDGSFLRGNAGFFLTPVEQRNVKTHSHRRAVGGRVENPVEVGVVARNAEAQVHIAPKFILRFGANQIELAVFNFYFALP